MEQQSLDSVQEGKTSIERFFAHTFVYLPRFVGHQLGRRRISQLAQETFEGEGVRDGYYNVSFYSCLGVGICEVTLPSVLYAGETESFLSLPETFLQRVLREVDN